MAAGWFKELPVRSAHLGGCFFKARQTLTWLSLLLPCTGANPIISYYEIDILSRWGHLGVVAGFFFCWVLLAWIGLAYVKHQKR